MIKYKLDLEGATSPVDKYWNFCVGSCHAATALQKNVGSVSPRFRF